METRMNNKSVAAAVYCLLTFFEKTLHIHGHGNVSEPLPQLPQLRTFPPISHVFVTAPPPIHVPSNDIVINFENKNTSFLEIARQLNVRFGSRILKGCDLQSSRSCKGRCGTRERNKRLKCYCDGLCQDLGDCCYDYFNRCRKTAFRKVKPPMHSCFKPEPGFDPNTWNHGHIIISSCPFNTSSKLVRACIENDPSDTFRILPVFDKSSKKNYKNYFCATCNGATNITYWKAVHGCLNVHIQDFSSFNLTSFLQHYCRDWSWKFIPPKNDITDYCHIIKHRGCNKLYKSNETNLKDICEAYLLPVCMQPMHQYFGTLYNNPHCLLCDVQPQGPRIDAHCLECPQPPTHIDQPGLQILFDFSSSAQYQLNVGWERTVIKTTRCKSNQVYDPFSRSCRDVPKMPVLKKTKIVDVLLPSLRNSSFPTNKSIVNPSRVPKRENGVTNSASNDTLACVPVFFNNDEVELFPNGSLYIKSHKRLYGKTSYIVLKKGIALCTNFSQNYTEKSFIKGNKGRIHPLALSVITNVGGALSILSLTILIAVYVWIKEIKKLPGKIVMSLACALLVFQVVFFLTGATRIPALCSAVAVVLHYFLLASFTWMNVLAFDMAFTFSSTKHGMATLPASDGDIRIFFKYCCHGWITPMVWVGVCMSLELSHTMSIGYGSHNSCWISNGEALLYVVCVPVAVILAFNLAALVLSVVAIRRTRQNTRQVSKDSKPLDLPLLSLKLTVIFGLTWALGFAAAFEETAFIWYPFVILNSFQGVSLFVALKVYIKVYHLLKGDGSDQLSGVTDSKSQSKEREELQLKQSTIKPITQERCLYKEEPTVSTEM